MSTNMLLLRIALLVCVACCWAAAGHKPVQLTDNTFEGATQASTGQTTGHWQVLAYAASQCMPFQVSVTCC